MTTDHPLLGNAGELADSLAAEDPTVAAAVASQLLEAIKLKQDRNAGSLPLHEVGDNPYDSLPRNFPLHLFEALEQVTGARRDPLLRDASGSDFRSKLTRHMKHITIPMVVHREDLQTDAALVKALDDGNLSAEEKEALAKKAPSGPCKVHTRPRRFMVKFRQEWVPLGYSLGDIDNASPLDPGSIVDERLTQIETIDQESVQEFARDVYDQVKNAQKVINEQSASQLVEQLTKETSTFVENSTSAGLGLTGGVGGFLGAAKGLVTGGASGFLGLGASVGTSAATSTVINSTNKVDRSASRTVNEALQTAERRVNEHLSTATRTLRSVQRRLERVVNTVSPLMSRVTNLMRWEMYQNYAVLSVPERIEEIVEKPLCEHVKPPDDATSAGEPAIDLKDLLKLYHAYKSKRIKRDEYLEKAARLMFKKKVTTSQVTAFLKKLWKEGKSPPTIVAMDPCSWLASAASDFTIRDIVDLRWLWEGRLLDERFAEGFEQARALEIAESETPVVVTGIQCEIDFEINSKNSKTVIVAVPDAQATGELRINENQQNAVIALVLTPGHEVHPSAIRSVTVQFKIRDFPGPDNTLYAKRLVLHCTLSDGTVVSSGADFGLSWYDRSDSTEGGDVTGFLPLDFARPKGLPMPRLLQHMNENKEYYLGLLFNAALHDRNVRRSARQLRPFRDLDALWNGHVVGFNGLQSIELFDRTPVSRPGEQTADVDAAVASIWEQAPEGTLLQLLAPGNYSEAIEGLLTLTDALGKIHPGLSPPLPPAGLPLNITLNTPN